MTWDPLAGIDPPTGDPGALEVMVGRMTAWLSGCEDFARQQQSAVDSVTEADWKGLGAAAARSGAVRVAAAYRQAAGDMEDAIRVVARCAGEWTDAQVKYAQARRMADEAMDAAVAAASAGLLTVGGPGGSHGSGAGWRWGGWTESGDSGSSLAAEMAARARALAASAVDDFENASARAAAALDGIAGRIDSTPAFVAHRSSRSWFEGPVTWGSDALHVGERAAQGALHVGQYVASNPDVFGRLVDDALQVGGGAALMAAGAAGFGTGVVLDLTGAGLPVGIPLDALSTAGMAAGTGLLIHGSMDGMGDLTGGGGSGDAGGGDSGGGTGGEARAPQEGDVNFRVVGPDGKEVTDIDLIRGGVLWEIKTAIWSSDDMAWVAKHITEKFAKYLEARTLMPGYGNAPIGWDFVAPGALPEFRMSVETAVAELRTLNPDVTIYLRWAP